MILKGSIFVWKTLDTFLDVHEDLKPVLRQACGES